jgi:hypothetical protein
MNTWEILNKELNYYGIRLLKNGRCQFYINNKLKTQGIHTTIRQFSNTIKKHTDVFKNLFNETIELISKNEPVSSICDKRMEDLFIFLLKDAYSLLTSFDDPEAQQKATIMNNAFNRDIKSFSKNQIYKFLDYKITIDWIYRRINRLIYLRKLLSFSLMGRDRIAKYNMKTARGVTGPRGNLDLPMQERVFSWDDQEFNKDVSKQKQKQERYRKGFEAYNEPGVAEGHYWRELRNEGFAWSDRGSESSYPSRNRLMNL